jgi:hypothetical protein
MPGTERNNKTASKQLKAAGQAAGQQKLSFTTAQSSKSKETTQYSASGSGSQSSKSKETTDDGASPSGSGSQAQQQDLSPTSESQEGKPECSLI